MHDQDGHKALPNALPYSGVTTATLTITGVTATMEGYHYRVIVSNTNNVCSVLNSTDANLSVIVPLVANDDTPAPIDGLVGGSTTSVLLNDTLGGLPFNPSAVVLTPLSIPNGLTLNADGTITVNANTPAGTYPVIYQICSVNNPASCSSATAFVVVNIYTTPDVNIGNIGTTIAGNVATNDSAPIGTTYGNPIITGSNPDATLPIINSDGSYTFNPTLPGVYSFGVAYCIPPGIISCPTEPLVITVLAPLLFNNPPVAVNDAGITQLNSSVTLFVTANDAAGNAGQTLSTLTLPSTTTSYGGTISVDASGNVVYVPATGFVGVDTFTYTICETPSGLCSSATVQVTVLPAAAVNTTLAADDYTTTVNGVTAVGNVSVNDIDPEGNTQTVIAQAGVLLLQGTFNLLSNGSYTFVPALGFTGTVAIPYTTCDNGVPTACSTATLYILVNNDVLLD